MNPYSIPPLMSGFLVLLLAAYVISNKGSGAIGKVFFVLSLSVFIWLVSFSIVYSMTDPLWALFWSRFAYLGVAFLPITSIHFHLELLKQRPIRLLIGLYIAGFMFVLLSWTDLFFNHVKDYFWGFYPQASVLYSFFLVFFVPVLWAGPLLCFREAFLPQPDSKLSVIQLKQLRLVVVAFFIANFGSFDFLAKFGVAVYPFGYLNMVIWFIILAFAINQYRLMDIESAAELVQSAKLAKIGMLTAGINHEIRNPLYIIKSQAQIFLENMKEGIYGNSETAVKEALRLMSKAGEQADRAADIVRKLSEFARPKTKENTNQPVDILECLDYVLELIRYETQLGKIMIKKNMAQGIPQIRADRRQIEEIFFNLILNACQAMSLSGGVLTILAWLRGKMIQVIVEDTGRGFSQEKLRHLFDPFFTTKKGGTGLGLYLTKQLVEKNGGKIKIESKENAGARAHLEFQMFIENRNVLDKKNIREDDYETIKRETVGSIGKLE